MSLVRREITFRQPNDEMTLKVLLISSEQIERRLLYSINLTFMQVKIFYYVISLLLGTIYKRVSHNKTCLEMIS